MLLLLQSLSDASGSRAEEAVFQGASASVQLAKAQQDSRRRERALRRAQHLAGPDQVLCACVITLLIQTCLLQGMRLCCCCP
jgi:hypothetical protein